MHAPGGVSEQVLGGETDQGRQVRLHLDENGRARGLDTHVETICKGGHRWSADWTPRVGDATFRQPGGRLVVREVVERPDELGRIERIGALMNGRVEGDRAGGELRLVSRYYKDGREVQACDSGPVRWAVGVDAKRRLANALPPRRPTDWYYPQVPSLAGSISQARRRFIRRTDNACAGTFGAARAYYEATVRAAGNPASELAAYSAYVDAHAAQLRTLGALGAPPDGVRLHARWLDNMRARIRLEREVLRLAAAGDAARVRAAHSRIARLKLLGNELGQRFGLRICTSNGPDRTPAPR